MKIERVEELRLSKRQEVEISQIIAANFSADFDGRSFFQNRHHCRFLHYQNGELVGHLAICYRTIQLGEERVNIIGIGEVAVAKQARRKGLGAALLQAAIDEGKSSQAEFAALFGEQSIYTKAGFSSAPNKIKLIEMEGARTKGVVEENNPYLMVLPLRGKKWNTTLDVDLAGFAF
ncbi:MAG: GNAT family N-acetyltransferase [Rhizobiaceae bacterium]